MTAPGHPTRERKEVKMDTRNKQFYPRTTPMGLSGRLVLLVVWLLAACSEMNYQPVETYSCALNRLSRAEGYFVQAKEEMMLFYKQRNDGPLLRAFFLASDAEALALSLKRCPDLQPYKRQGLNLISASKALRRVALMNMRDEDPWLATSVFGDEYRDIFRYDIR
ncbi:MAG: hypothetical protein OEW12_04585 [Deltaproteobacteria bacterium]|nr:hypothetical protein [Deltaproteobacteria bacterium]